MGALVVHGTWQWEGPIHGEHFRRCSYCGSIHPWDLAAEPTWRADWADQKYGWPHKFYVEIPNRDPNRLYCTGSASGPRADQGYIAFRDLTEYQREVVKRDGWRTPGEGYASAFMFGTRASHFGKFYTIHLSDPSMEPLVKTKIEQVCGLEFTFNDDGRIGWRKST